MKVLVCRWNYLADGCQGSRSTLGSSSNPEFSFGAFLYFKDNQNTLVKLVASTVQNGALSANSNRATEISLLWLEHMREGKPFAATDKLVGLLDADASRQAREILSLKNYFALQSKWLVGSDAWSHDLGSSGVHSGDCAG